MSTLDRLVRALKGGAGSGNFGHGGRPGKRGGSAPAGSGGGGGKAGEFPPAAQMAASDAVEYLRDVAGQYREDEDEFDDALDIAEELEQDAIDLTKGRTISDQGIDELDQRAREWRDDAEDDDYAAEMAASYEALRATLTK